MVRFVHCVATILEKRRGENRIYIASEKSSSQGIPLWVMLTQGIEPSVDVTDSLTGEEDWQFPLPPPLDHVRAHAAEVLLRQIQRPSTEEFAQQLESDHHPSLPTMSEPSTQRPALPPQHLGSSPSYPKKSTRVPKRRRI